MPDVESHASERGTEIEQLTLQACRAAEQGDWDAVVCCVNRRGELLADGPLPLASPDRLKQLDGRIHALAETAKTAVAAKLLEAGQTRRRLQQLRERAAGPESTASRLMNVRA
jgi:hypothetical protein